MNRLISILKSLSDPTRLKIMNIVNESERCVCEIQEALEIPQSTLSCHLKVLINSGLVVCRKEGTNVYYRGEKLEGELNKAVQIILSEFSG